MSSARSPRFTVPSNGHRFNSPATSPRSFKCLTSPPTSPRSKPLPFHPIYKASEERVQRKHQELLTLLESYKVQVSHLKTLITSMNECLIAQINLQSAQVLSKLHDIEKTLVHEIESVKSEPDLTSRSYFYLSKSFLEMPLFDSRIADAVNAINESYSFEFLKKFPIPENVRKEFFTFFPGRGSGYSKIDLENLKGNLVEVECCDFNSGCEIDNGILFLHGGFKNFEPSRETCFLDVYLDKFESLPHSNYSRNNSACVKKGEKIYVFGSSSPNPRFSERFDLNELTWTKITQLPQDVTNITGSLISQNLALTATGLTGYWVFNESDLYEFINIEASAGYKALCDNLLLTNSCIFELCKDGKSWTAQKFPSNWIAAPLGISFAYKRKGFIYFMDCKQKLYRVNPLDKTLIELHYS